MADGSNAAEEQVRAFFSALNTKDGKAVADVLRPDATWTLMMGAGGSLRAEGVDDILTKFVHGAADTFAPGDPKTHVRQVVADGNRAMAETTGSGKRKDGKAYDNVYAWAFELEDGKIAHLREYTDTAYAIAFLTPDEG